MNVAVWVPVPSELVALTVTVPVPAGTTTVEDVDVAETTVADEGDDKSSSFE